MSLRRVPKQSPAMKVLRTTISKGFARAVAPRAVAVTLQRTGPVHLPNSGRRIIYIHGLMTLTAW